MFRGLALLMLLLNLALLLWGSSRPLPERDAAEIRDQSSTDALPTLRLIDAGPAVTAREQAFPEERCLRFGPLGVEESASAVEKLAAWNLAWRRSEEGVATVLEIRPGSGSDWPEEDIRALAASLASEIFPCRIADPIAPEAPKP